MVFKKETTDADRQPKFVVDESGLLTKFVAWKSSVSTEDRSQSQQGQEDPEPKLPGDFHSVVDDVERFAVRCSVCGSDCYTEKRLEEHMFIHNGVRPAKPNRRRKKSTEPISDWLASILRLASRG